MPTRSTGNVEFRVRSAEPEVSPDEIPTLELEVRVAKIPLLDTPLEVLRDIDARPRAGPASAARTNERQPPRRSSRRTSRWIITTVALGLLAAVSIASVVDALFADGIDKVDGNTPARRPEARVPTLVLLGESWRVPRPLLTSTQLLESIAELLKTRELRDEATIDFVLQTLKAILLADADNNVARQRLDDLTRQLSDEARAQFDQGNAPLARRLIQQASNSGLAYEYVTLAGDYIATQKPTAATSRSPAAVTSD